MRSQPPQPHGSHAPVLESDALHVACILIHAIRCSRRVTRPMQPTLQQILWQRRTKDGQHNGISVVWRKRRHTHLEIVNSHEVVARRLPSSADTGLSISTSRRCSCGALRQLQMQLTALAVLQLQHADTPQFVSASNGGLQRSPSEHGDESRKTKGIVRRAITPAPHSCSGDA